MNTLQMLTQAEPDDLAQLGVTGMADQATLPSADKFDNRPTWDNASKRFDNRPSWDNWNKK